jgi:hypothetical protein
MRSYYFFLKLKGNEEKTPIPDHNRGRTVPKADRDAIGL